MPKNVVVCCDGTGNEFGDRNSNVVKLFSTLEIDPAAQVGYYDPGLGTMGARNVVSRTGKWATKILGLAFGYGLADNLSDAYRYLMQTWQPGDRLFLFGFSRGAYTVRALASMLHMFGLLPPENAQLIAYMMRLFKRSTAEDLATAFRFKATFSNECQPYFVGVWDTVSSVGWAYDPLKLRFTKNNPDIRIGRHAISIDERRCFFRQNLWGAPGVRQDYKQVWFPGVHSDVGGGYREEESGLAKIALEWMLTEARAAGLRVRSDQAEDVLGLAPGSRHARPEPAAEMHNSMCAPWPVLEYLPRRRWNEKTQSQEWILPRKRPRTIPPGSFIHQSVFDRMATPETAYSPKLPQQYHVEPWSARGPAQAAANARTAP